MRILGKIAGGLFGLLLLIGLGAYSWFWWKPVGVNNYINKASLELLLDSPELLTSLGLIDNTPLDFHSNKLDSYTNEQQDKSLAKLRRARAGLNKYGPDGLDGQELLSWQIAAWFFDDLLRQAEFDYGEYPVNQISGATVSTPQFLTDTHAIINEKSAKRYVSRVTDFGRVLREMKDQVEEYRDNGVVAPDFILVKAISGMESFIEGGAPNNPLVTTLPERLDKVESLSEARKSELIEQVTRAVETQVIPGYQAMIALHKELLQTASHDAGIWRIPEGRKIYAAALKSNTTTDLSANEIHNLGLSEVVRIEQEMDAILLTQGLNEGSVAQRVQSLMTDPAYIFPNNDEGRKQMLDFMVELNDALMEKAGDYFVTLPPQKLEIKRVPEYAQDSAPGGYYQGPALDGSRAGQFYINLKDTADNPRWTLPTLLYHEAAPGHHFQISRAMLIEDVPFLRTLSPFSAYTEGWALYAERLVATDMGMYDDNPLGNLGRLQAEMFRAVRLVVDTGLHDKRWSRERAIRFMIEKTGMTQEEVTREIERYSVWPGQATAYKTGQLAMLRLRTSAEERLGEKFVLRDFNEFLLANGAMPLGILEDTVEGWITDQE